MRRRGLQTCPAAVVSVDLANFSNIAATLTISERVGLLQLVLGTVAVVIERRGGRIAGFPGDAVLAFFPVLLAVRPESVVDRAVRCMTEIMRWASYGARLQQISLPRPSHRVQLSVGIDYGEVTWAPIGASQPQVVLLGSPADRACKGAKCASQREIVIGQDARDLSQLGGWFRQGPSVGLTVGRRPSPYQFFRFDWEGFGKQFPQNAAMPAPAGPPLSRPVSLPPAPRPSGKPLGLGVVPLLRNPGGRG